MSTTQDLVKRPPDEFVNNSLNLKTPSRSSASLSSPPSSSSVAAASGRTFGGAIVEAARGGGAAEGGAAANLTKGRQFHNIRGGGGKQVKKILFL